MGTMTTIYRVALASVVSVIVIFTPGCSTDPEYAKREYVKSGDRFVEEKKYAEAILQYRNALQQDSRFGEARLKLAQVYETQGDSQNATREYVRAADALPNDPAVQVKAGAFLSLSQRFEDARARAEAALRLDKKNVDAHVVLGNALAGLRDIDGALEQLEEAAALDPHAGTLRSSIGVMEGARGRHEDAEAAFRKAIELSPKAPEVHVAFANYLLSRRRDPEAEQALKAAVSIDPTNRMALRTLAAIYMSTRRPLQAVAPLKALADRDTSPGARDKLALADYYVLVNRPDEAMKVLSGLSKGGAGKSAAQSRLATLEYSRSGKTAGNRTIDEVIAHDPGNTLALIVKTRFQMAEGALDDALKTAKTATASDPQSIQAWYMTGTILRAKRRNQEAIAAFNEVLKINPRAVGAQLQLAELNLQQGRSAQAIQLAGEAVRQLPQDLRARLTQVRSLIAGGRLPEAQKTMALVLKAVPNLAPVQTTAGLLAIVQKDRVGARRAYMRAAELDADNIEALNGLVMLDVEEQKYDSAKARVDQRLSRTPSNPAVLTIAARAYAAGGDEKRAEELLRKTIEVEPSNIDAYGTLGRLYARQHRLAEARTSFEGILKEQPDSVPVQTIVALLYQAEGNWAEARKRYERVMEIEPEAAVAANNLAYIYTEDGGNLDLALHLAQTAKRHLPDNSEVADTLGWVYVKKGLPTLGIPHLEQAVTKSPKNPTLQFHLGVALVEAGEGEKGRQALERALNLNLAPGPAAEARELVVRLK